MDFGAKLAVVILGGIALFATIYLLWSRFIWFPADDPSASSAQEGDGSALDPRPHHQDDSSHS